ncbi:hypothetical protein [Mycobacterium phage PP]|uniref:Uncharacterized protein n=1 Tax=Mycobacterium phage PP TaxID=2077134 RepID=A0A2Z5XVH9_9CAUD|nr:hypothetical protein KIW36_gp35 [Mycobacterium phage PP]BBC53856.1 hypothetical protein [Mycobacterium phage PP]
MTVEQFTAAALVLWGICAFLSLWVDL